MALNSINTNVTAGIALQSLELTNSELASVQKQISTGYRVADAVDDGAAFAIAQRVRSDVGALSTANTQLGSVQGLLSTTVSALTDVSNTLGSARDVLVNLASSATQGTQRSQYIAQYQSLIDNVRSFFEDASYNGKSLVGNISSTSTYSAVTASTAGFAAVNVIRNEAGSTYGIATYSGCGLVSSISFTAADLGNATTVAGFISTSATSTTNAFINQLNALGTALNRYGASTNYVVNQVNYNSDKITALNNGVGSLVDADLAKESAQLQSLQIRQQLGTQALSIANQAPQSLLSLFK